ncbi:MAG: TetR/AcrR family transcriptional regulator [Spirochaetaceae bacterium]|nr:MAG: TetR/AcrR family transcriptional regulator [Spirochaetaceae bacterium]
MSQSKQKRLEQKRATILATAESVLIKYGKNATMGDIAKALDMDKSSLYYYYKGIPEILNAILDQEYYDFSVHINQIRKENKSHLDVLREMIRVILEFYHDNLEILLIILTRIFPLFIDPDTKEESAAINAYMDSYREANVLMLEEIKLALNRGEFKVRFSPEMILQTLRGAVFGVCAVWRKYKPQRDEIPRIVDQLLAMYT